MRDSSFFLDTNIFLRIIVKDDPKKVGDCENLIRLISKKEIRAYTSSLVLAELVWTCLGFYKISKAEIIKIIQGIVSIKNLKIEDKTNPFLAIQTYEFHGIKFIDALIASNPAIVKGKAKIVSYDKDFDKLGVGRVEPDQLKK